MIEVIIKPKATWAYKSMIKLALEKVKGANIIYANSLVEGLPNVKSEFVCYIGNAIVDTDYFNDNLNIFIEYPAFKKLSIVSSATLDKNLSKRVYGYTLDPDGVKPVYKKASSMPYALQIAYLPGAIIRFSAIDHIKEYLTGDDLKDSYQASVDFWMTGKRCYINPRSTYIDYRFNPTDDIKFSKDPWANHEPMQKIKLMWKREVI